MVVPKTLSSTSPVQEEVFSLFTNFFLGFKSKISLRLRFSWELTCIANPDKSINWLSQGTRYDVITSSSSNHFWGKMNVSQLFRSMIKAKLVDNMKKRRYLSVILHVRDIENIAQPRRDTKFLLECWKKILVPKTFFSKKISISSSEWAVVAFG